MLCGKLSNDVRYLCTKSRPLMLLLCFLNTPRTNKRVFCVSLAAPMREKCLKASGTGLAHFRNKLPQSTSRLLSVGIVKSTCYFVVFCF